MYLFVQCIPICRETKPEKAQLEKEKDKEKERGFWLPAKTKIPQISFLYILLLLLQPKFNYYFFSWEKLLCERPHVLIMGFPICLVHLCHQYSLMQLLFLFSPFFF